VPRSPTRTLCPRKSCTARLPTTDLADTTGLIATAEIGKSRGAGSSHDRRPIARWRRSMPIDLAARRGSLASVGVVPAQGFEPLAQISRRWRSGLAGLVPQKSKNPPPVMPSRKPAIRPLRIPDWTVGSQVRAAGRVGPMDE